MCFRAWAFRIRVMIARSPTRPSFWEPTNFGKMERLKALLFKSIQKDLRTVGGWWPSLRVLNCNFSGSPAIGEGSPTLGMDSK